MRFFGFPTYKKTLLKMGKKQLVDAKLHIETAEEGVRGVRAGGKAHQ